MSEIPESVGADDQPEITPTRSQDTFEENSSEMRLNHRGNAENGISQENRKTKDNGQELPELNRDKEERKEMMPGLPSINLTELTVILRDPSMPSHKIMKEVAEKMMLKSEESESDDGSVGSSGGTVGMKGLLDCIFEVTFHHTDADNSDDDDDSFERIPREIPCSLCNKIFGSTMTWKTHVLVAHQDPSVLNIRRLSTNEADRKEKNHPVHRRHSRGTSKADSDLKNTKARHASKTDTRELADALHDEKEVPAGKRHSSISKSHQNEISGEFLSSKHHVDRESLPTELEENYGAASNYSGDLTKDVIIKTYQHERVDIADHTVTIDPLQITETNLRDIEPDEKGKRLPSPTDEAESLEFDHITQEDETSQQMKNLKHKQMEDSNITSESLICKGEGRKKRKATSPVQESSTSGSALPTSLSDTKRSRTHITK